MKECPKCKAALEDNARFCLYCMTSLEEKEQILPPERKLRRWPLVLLCALFLGVLLFLVIDPGTQVPEETTEPSQPVVTEQSSTLSQTVDGVRYTFRPATKQDHPAAVTLDNHYVLIRVEGTPADGIYRVPTFVNNDTNALVTVVADGAFAGTNARAIDLGYNVRFVWGNAFGGYPLEELYLHEDVLIAQEAFSGCTESMTIHCPEYLENTEGVLWSELAVRSGFRWQPEVF